MKMSSCSLGLVLVLFCIGGLNAQAAQSSSQADKQDRRLTLDVVVDAKNGSRVSGLTQQNFMLTDNKSAVPITGFREVVGREIPTEVILLVDAVNVNFTNLANERSRVERFLKMTEHLPVPTALAVFTDEGLQVQEGYSQNGGELGEQLDRVVTGIRTTRRSSQHEEQDRFNLSITALNQLVARESKRPGRKLIFWVSPGWPLLSGAHVDLTGRQQEEVFRGIVHLTNLMLQARITLYSLNPLGVEEGIERTFYYKDFLKAVTKTGQVEIGDLGLQVLATQSGGLALNSSNDLESELAKCFADATASYEVSFDAGQGDATGGYHHVDVQVAKPGMSARARNAYHAQP